MSLLDQLSVAGSVIGAISLALVFYFPIFQAWRRRRSQVREVWVSIDETWEPVDGNINSRLLTSGRLIVRNPTPWSLDEVMVMQPPQLTALNFTNIGPRSKVELLLPARLTNDISGEPLVLQVTDSQHLVWRWTPSEQKAELLSQRTDRLSRAERWAARNVRSRVEAVEPPVQD